jgi:hypothetical protein
LFGGLVELTKSSADAQTRCGLVPGESRPLWNEPTRAADSESIPATVETVTQLPEEAAGCGRDHPETADARRRYRVTLNELISLLEEYREPASRC